MDEVEKEMRKALASEKEQATILEKQCEDIHKELSLALEKIDPAVKEALEKTIALFSTGIRLGNRYGLIENMEHILVHNDIENSLISIIENALTTNAALLQEKSHV